jgi:hypothetical protein
MKHTHEIRQWTTIVDEAVEGETDFARSIEKNLKLYGREAAQFDLPKDYPEIKTAADLLNIFSKYIQTSVDSIEDPLAQSLLSRLKNLNPTSISRQLDNLAKAKNPEKT